MFDNDNKMFTYRKDREKEEERRVYFLFQDQKIARADYRDNLLSFHFIAYF